MRVSGKHPLTKDRLIISVKGSTIIGNLRTTTKFTTTTSVDWEKTGTRTSVSAGKRKLKVQSVGRSTKVDDDDTECKQTSRSSRTVMFVRDKVFCNGVF